MAIKDPVDKKPRKRDGWTPVVTKKAPGATTARVLPRVQLDIDVYEAAKERIRIALRMHDHVAVAFSGGKDSTCVLNLVLEVLHEDEEMGAKHLPLRVVFGDEECIPLQTVDYVRRVAQRPDVALEWYCIPMRLRNGCSRDHPEWWTWAPESEELWARPLPPEAITHIDGFPAWPPEARLSWPETNELLFPPSLGNCALFMGIRALESLTRARAVQASSGREFNWLIKMGKSGGHSGRAAGNVYKAYPIYDWETEDVWTAAATRGWDYNRAYDAMEMLGLGHSTQRCSPAFGEEPMQKLWVFAQAFPEVWGKMTARVPGVGAAYRYATTELYGFKKRPEKPVGMPWPEFIRHYIKQHPTDVQHKLAARVTDMIRRHYRVTTQPIAAKTNHPDSGLCWDFILMVVIRGDFKERKQPTHYVEAKLEFLVAHWPKYIKEIEEAIADGTFDDWAYPRPAPSNPRELIPKEYRSEH